MRTLLRLAVAGAVAYVAAMALLAWDGSRPRPDPDDGGVAAILVLGSGGVNPDGSPTPRERARLDAAVAAAKDRPRALVVASGAAEINGHSEAALMAAYLAAHGIPVARIVPDPAGATTWDSARNLASFLRDRGLEGRESGGVLVVSEYFHIPRARLALGRFGVAPRYSLPAFHVGWGDLRAVAREVAGWLIYRCRPLS